MIETQHNSAIPAPSRTPPAAPRPSSPPQRRRRFLTKLSALLAVLVGLGGGYCAWNYPELYQQLPELYQRLYDGCDDAEESGMPPASPVANDYKNWPRPLVALVLSGQMHGYVDPCGCSHPQYGGLIRRYNFIESLRAGNDKEKGWDIVGIDMGEMAYLKGIRAQNILKFELSMNALSTMHYRAIGIGTHELRSPLAEALVGLEKTYPRPLGLTLAQAAKGELYHGLNVRPYEIIANTKPKIGVISMMGPDMRAMLKSSKEKFADNVLELPKALKAFADAGVEIGIILHHEHPEVDAAVDGIKRMETIEKVRKDMARLCAEFCARERKKNPKIPPIQLMMILTDEPEPPAVLHPLDPKLPTQIVEIGHKGKYVGLVGIFQEADGYRLKYEIVAMGEEWETKKGAEDKNPVIGMMEKYHEQLRKDDFLAKYPRTMHFNQIPPANQKGLAASYVGSQRCGDCHENAWKVWKNSKHAIATDTLENKDKRPLGRQFDPECVMCHTVGFKHPGGYHDPVDAAFWPARNPDKPFTPERLKKHNKELRGVGCESCHGPGSEHVKNPDNKALYPLINSIRNVGKNKNIQALERFCITCHDHENDVNWGKPNHEAFDMWRKIAHPSQPNNNGVNLPVAPPPVVLNPKK